MLNHLFVTITQTVPLLFMITLIFFLMMRIKNMVIARQPSSLKHGHVQLMLTSMDPATNLELRTICMKQTCSNQTFLALTDSSDSIQYPSQESGSSEPSGSQNPFKPKLSDNVQFPTHNDIFMSKQIISKALVKASTKTPDSCSKIKLKKDNLKESGYDIAPPQSTQVANHEDSKMVKKSNEYKLAGAVPQVKKKRFMKSFIVLSKRLKRIAREKVGLAQPEVCNPISKVQDLDRRIYMLRRSRGYTCLRPVYEVNEAIY